MFHHPRTLCPTCRTEAVLARITPGHSGFDIRTFECPACEDVHQLVAALVDPDEIPTNNWLASRSTGSADVAKFSQMSDIKPYLAAVRFLLFCSRFILACIRQRNTDCEQ